MRGANLDELASHDTGDTQVVDLRDVEVSEAGSTEPQSQSARASAFLARSARGASVPPPLPVEPQIAVSRVATRTTRSTAFYGAVLVGCLGISASAGLAIVASFHVSKAEPTDQTPVRDRVITVAPVEIR